MRLIFYSLYHVLNLEPLKAFMIRECVSGTSFYNITILFVGVAVMTAAE